MATVISTRAIEEAVRGVLDEVIAVRRTLHRHPELAHQEHATTALLAKSLADHGVSAHVREPSGTGLVAEIGSSGPMVAWRCDLDALSITEPAVQPFASRNPGVMHACGHDAHAAIGLGVALTLSRLGPLPGRVRIIFQHSEESLPSGAAQMVEEKVMEGVQAIAALHVDPTLDLGKVGIKSGAITSSSDLVKIVLRGPGGHTARPHLTTDLLYAAGKVITDLPGLLGRMIDPRIAFSLTFGQIQGGTAENVIPTEVIIRGTCRTSDPDLRNRLPEVIRRLIRELAAITGAEAEVVWRRVLSPVYNHPQVVETVRRSIIPFAGPNAVVDTFTSLGAEDFSHYLDCAPGMMMRLGTMTEGDRRDLHSAWFQISEACLPMGVKAAVGSVLGLLSEPVVD